MVLFRTLAHILCSRKNVNSCFEFWKSQNEFIIMKAQKTFLFIFIITCIFSCLKKSIKVDILIKNGIVFSGIDSIPRYVSIAIKDDKIIRCI